MKEMVGGCCVCSDERGWPDNPLVYCDGNGCTVAVHQACYGIVTVPTGPWYCRKCESPENKGKVRCELCPSRSGALKKADTGGWAHVVCALYIPEVRFGNVTSMEPIVLRLIPPERFTRTCYICTENGKSHRAGQGACMACNKSGCKQQFHVTCAQSLGLLCEEAGNYLDNVKYCGYCQHHYAKLKKGGNVKTIPPYKPVAHDSQSSGSSSEKEGGASPMAAGSGTPTAHAKGSKGPGRKTSQNKDTSKNSNASKAVPTTTAQPMDKKKSPSRRQSSTGEGGSSKTSTPAPSPSHNADLGHPSKPSGSGGAGSSRATPPSASPNANKSPQPGGVISSVASATAAVSSAPATTPSTSVGVTTSVVQAPSTKQSVTFQESVITNTDAMETKHTKKRKAAAAAASAAAEQAAQAIANESAPPIEPEPRVPMKRKAVLDSRPACPPKLEKKTPNINELAACALDLENIKHNKKRKAAAAAAAAAESPRPANSPRPTSSPMNVERETPPILSATPPLEVQDQDTKQTKKRKAAAAAAAERETPPIASDLSASPSPVAEMETKHTKKRKAAAAASAAAASAAAERNVLTPISFANEPQPGPSGAQWEHAPPSDSPIAMDISDKSVKKVKTDSSTPPPAHYLNTPLPLPPPPPPPPMRSPRHLTSPLPGPSGMHPPLMNPPSNIRSPSQLQATTEMPAPPSPHVFHQPSKPPAMDSGIPVHSPHGHSQRTTWGGLNVTYEMQQDPNKPSGSGIAGSSKDHSGIPMPPMPSMPPAMRNKKRAAMAAVSMANQPPLPPPQSSIQMASTSTHSLANVRRHPHPQMPPQQIYQETLKDSPPVSPNTERQLKAKAEQQYYSKLLSAAPHMLGNELNPDSGAATRLQEQLNAELAAHAVGGAGPDPIVLPPLFNKAVPGTSGRSTGAQSLDQLLERQWEQGSQFLMEQAQHFDNEMNKFTFKRRHVADADVAQLYLHAEHKRIASLLSCLHQLRTENVRLEEHVANLLQRRDHLLAVNARLAIPLNSASAPQSEPPRCSREPGPPRAPPPRAQDDRHADRHAERQLSHQLVMREVQQKPS